MCQCTNVLFLDIIENNVETARDKVEDGVVELKKASDYQVHTCAHVHIPARTYDY